MFLLLLAYYIPITGFVLALRLFLHDIVSSSVFYDVAVAPPIVFLSIFGRTFLWENRRRNDEWKMNVESRSHARPPHPLAAGLNHRARVMVPVARTISIHNNCRCSLRHSDVFVNRPKSFRPSADDSVIPYVFPAAFRTHAPARLLLLVLTTRVVI